MTMLIFVFLYTVLCIPVTTTVRNISEEVTTEEKLSATIHNVPSEDITHPDADPDYPREDVPWTKEDIPDPQFDVWLCGNDGNQSHVCNPDHVLTREEGKYMAPSH